MILWELWLTSRCGYPVAQKLRAQGALLVTHWGVSGPAALKLSSYAARLLAENDYKHRLPSAGLTN